MSLFLIISLVNVLFLKNKNLKKGEVVNINKNHQTKIHLLLFLFVLAFAVTIQSVSMPLSTRVNYSDSSVYQYIGKIILENEMPYKDAFDHKGMLLYLINAMGYFINPHWGIWLIDTVVLFGIMLYAFKISNIFLNEKMSLVIIILCLSGLYRSYWIGNTPDYYATFVLMVVFYCLIQYFRVNSLSLKMMIITGVCGGILFWLTTIIPLGILCVGILFDICKKKNYKLFIQTIIYSTVSFICISLPLLLWIYFNGALKLMIQDYFWFNLFYAGDQQESSQKIIALIKFLSNPSVFSVLIFLLGTWIFKILDDENTKSILTITTLSFVITLFSCAITGRGYGQYILILYPSMIIIISLITKELLNKVPMNSPIILAIFVLMFAYVFIPNLQCGADNIKKNIVSRPIDKKIVEFIDDNTSKNDLITIVSPDHCGFYAECNRKSATTYPYVQASFYGNERIWNEYLNQINEKQPKILVWNNNWPIDIWYPRYLEKYKEEIKSDEISLYIRKEGK